MESTMSMSGFMALSSEWPEAGAARRAARITPDEYTCIVDSLSNRKTAHTSQNAKLVIRHNEGIYLMQGS